jgi:hypothetical protein
MTRTAPHDARPFKLGAALATILLILATSVLLIGSAGAQERTGDPAKWRNYWTQLYTVFTHPRCINCHGATDPRSGENHGGGALDTDDDFQCFGCHTANTMLVPGRCENGSRILSADGVTRVTEDVCVSGDEQGEVRVKTGETWHDSRSGNPPPFVGLDMRSLCLEVKKRKGPMNLLEHVRDDPLIAFAFEGRRAIADGPFGPVAPEPPPMSKDEFIEMLLRWITEAAMACNTDGTVTLTDNTMIDSRPSPFGNTSVRNRIDASVFIKSEVPTSELRYDETSTFVFRPVAPGCAPTSSGEVHFTAEGKPAARYEIEIGPGNTYRMRFLLGAVEGKTDLAYREQLCRPPQARREQLPTEPATDLRFGLDEWQTALPPPPGEPGVLILRGSTSVPNDDFTGSVVVSGGERKITWDIVIR